MNHLFLLAQSVSDLQTKMGEVLNMIMIFGFLFGTIMIINGARMMRQGDYQAGKDTLIAGALIAGAPMLMRILYGLFYPGVSL